MSTTALTLEDIAIALKPTGLPDIIMYQYYKNLEKRTIIINEQITSNIVESVMLPLLEMDNDGTGEPINIVLNTLGGSLFDGATLCNIIDNLKTPTTITVFTYAYSMGSILLMAGYNNPNVKKRCYKHSTALLHAGSSYLEGDSMSVKDQFNFYQKFEDVIKEYTLSHSKITPEEYDKMERYEWYMTSDTMLEKGLVDEII
nr:MAG TPA: Protease subunit of ATP-dependent Clp protease [Caudoviricetes sp.]